ncbi:MAG: GntR family transcriptional regulator [candidate division NC10 bacterium]|nr:GntR family transcriptional regulator [candidate division NC10 bacterium]
MLREKAYERLKECLLAGKLKPGQLVSQKQLAKLVGCPVGPTREAIHKLAAESLLQVVPQRGIVVSDLGLEFIRNVLQLRAMIEREAIGPFLATTPPEEILALKRAHEAIIARAKKGIDTALMADAVELDWRLHDRIVTSLKNPLLEEIYRVNTNRIRVIRGKRGLLPERVVPVMKEHIAVLDAGLKNDPAAAAAALHKHLEEFRRWIVLI